MATVYYPGCVTGQLPFYVCDPCGNIEQARVRSVALVTDDYYSTLIADPTDPEIWQTGIESEDIIVIAKTSGTFEPSDPIVGQGFGNDIETFLGRDFTLTWTDPNYKQNCNFYNTLGTKNGIFHAVYRTSTQTHISPETVTLDASAPVTEPDSDIVVWRGRARWRSRLNPCPFDTPVGIFDCFALQD